jgi:hypothetical protein
MPYTRDGQLAAREPFLSGPCFIFKLHHTIFKFIVYTLSYQYNDCYLVINIVKYLNVIYTKCIRIAFKHSCTELCVLNLLF